MLNRRGFIKRASQSLAGLLGIACGPKSVSKPQAGAQINEDRPLSKKPTPEQTWSYSAYDDGELAYQFTFNRELSPEELSNLYDSPFDMFDQNGFDEGEWYIRGSQVNEY